MRILCGDIGGTKTLVQLVEVNNTDVTVLKTQRYSSTQYDQFDSILEDFLSADNYQDSISAACFGVAGPVFKSESSQTATITNLPWQMDSAKLARAFALPGLALINDFEAIAYGIPALTDMDLVTLQTGQSLPHGNQLVIGAGTGLGVAQLIWSGEEYLVISTEGGHTEFAPANELQLQLAEYLLKHKGRNSIEFVLSGSGLVNVFQFICETQQQLESDHYLSIMQATDPAAAISAAADERSDSAAYQAVQLFVQAYGGQTGNFALASLAMGGVFVAGGIAAKILAHLQTGEFIEAFNAKGKMSALMQKMTLKVITNPDVGLIGCRLYAMRLAEHYSGST